MTIKKDLLIIALITLLGFSLRIWKLTSSPSSLYIDETDIGYNAYSVIETGRDEHGKFLPLFFESFGDYKTPLYIYEVVLAQLIFGPTDFSVRIPAVVIGSLTIPVFYFLAKELLRESKQKYIAEYVPILSSFLLATSPWHIQFTRAAFGACLVVFLYSFGLLLFFMAMRKRSGLILVLSMIVYALTLYAYYSPRIITPIILFTLFVFYFKKFPFYWWIIATLAMGLLSYPAVAFSFTDQGLARARMISIFYQPTQYGIAKQFILNYLANISPYYLFVRGDPTIAHLTPHRMSLIHPIEFPFLLIGLFAFFKIRSRQFLLILIIFFIGFIPPTITILTPHALRGVVVLPGSIFISAFGLGYFLSLFKKKWLVKSLLVVYLVVISTFSIRFLYIYHYKYVIDAGWDWQVDAKGVGLKLLELDKNYDNVYINGGLRNIAIIWYLKYDPRLYQKSLDKNTIGKYHFEVNSYAQIVNNGRNLYVTSQNVPGGKLLSEIYYPNGIRAYGIWEI